MFIKKSLKAQKNSPFVNNDANLNTPLCAADLTAKTLLNDSNYYIYILTNYSKTLYTGVTNNLIRRVYEHKQKLIAGFTQKYNINRLVYYEETSDIREAIAREKQIKGWLRAKKIALIESMNPEWHDLSAGWYEK